MHELQVLFETLKAVILLLPPEGSGRVQEQVGQKQGPQFQNTLSLLWLSH